MKKPPVPFVIRYPKKIRKETLERPDLNVDFAPTLAEFTGVKMEMYETRFTGSLENSGRLAEEEIYYRYWTNRYPPGDLAMLGKVNTPTT